MFRLGVWKLGITDWMEQYQIIQKMLWKPREEYKKKLVFTYPYQIAQKCLWIYLLKQQNKHDYEQLWEFLRPIEINKLDFIWNYWSFYMNVDLNEVKCFDLRRFLFLSVYLRYINIRCNYGTFKKSLLITALLLCMILPSHWKSIVWNCLK